MADILYVHGPISARDFNSLCKSVGWQEVPDKNFEVAIKHSLHCVHVIMDGQVVGFARLVGDVGMYLYLQDLIVRKDLHGRGIGASLVKEIEGCIEKFEATRFRIGLIAETGVVPFYEALGYSESQPVSKYMARKTR
jgi:GNAT superfamily N-acetyltransferase